MFPPSVTEAALVVVTAVVARRLAPTYLLIITNLCYTITTRVIDSRVTPSPRVPRRAPIHTALARG